ncbi:MAG: histidine phosphatase family protein [Alphaproteobacteria bacterium]|nr:histidine phosphatase family protein [Alphaproteobacteria bacterium]
MKTLYLLRHAKSSWSDPTVEDHDRHLNERGRASGPVIGAYMRDRGYIPDFILCSSATRTLETLELVRPFLGSGIPTMVESGIYHVPAPNMLREVRRLPDTSARTLIIAHNPGLEDLIDMLARQPGAEHERAARAKVAGGFPTAALAVLVAPTATWSDVMPHECELADVVKPKELAQLED